MSANQVGRFTGIYEATIVDIRDVKGMRMVRAKVDALGDPNNDFITKWARPNNGVHQKDFARIGKGTFIQFKAPARTTDEPIWSGCYDAFPDGRSELTGIAQGPAQDPAPMNRGLFNVKTVSWADIGGPESAEVPEPSENHKTDPECNHTWSDGGIVEQRNTTPGAQRYILSVGSQYFELNAKGAEVSRVRGRFNINRGAERRYVGGMLTEVVAGRVRRDYKQDFAASVGGTVYALASALRAKLGTVTFTVDAKDGNDQVQGLRVESLGALELLSTSDLAVQGNTMRVTAMDVLDMTAFGDVFMNAAAPLATMRFTAPTSIVDVVGAGKFYVKSALPKTVDPVSDLAKDVAARALCIPPFLMSEASVGLFTALLSALGSELTIPGAATAAKALLATAGLGYRFSTVARFQ